MTSDRFDQAHAAIDDANRDDPKGREIPYSERMTHWTKRLASEPSDELLLAVRAQHIRRWEFPRGDYPEGRTGYIQWRENLKRFHSEKLGQIMEEAGYGKDSIDKAMKLVRFKNFAQDPEGQIVEDAACLVFLEMDFADLAAKTEEAKMIDILRKSWEKMSEAGREQARTVKLEKKETELLAKALKE